jgi:hypothetical protein
MQAKEKVFANASAICRLYQKLFPELSLENLIWALGQVCLTSTLVHLPQHSLVQFAQSLLKWAL